MYSAMMVPFWSSEKYLASCSIYEPTVTEQRNYWISRFLTFPAWEMKDGEDACHRHRQSLMSLLAAGCSWQSGSRRVGRRTMLAAAKALNLAEVIHNDVQKKMRFRTPRTNSLFPGSGKSQDVFLPEGPEPEGGDREYLKLPGDKRCMLRSAGRS